MLTYVVMPGLSGPKAAEIVARTQPEMKILYVSGYSDESVDRHALVAPGSAVLSKPFRLETLLRGVRELLNGGPASPGRGRDARPIGGIASQEAPQ
jgi:DNA-binding NarL/FixJ family response regulator